MKELLNTFSQEGIQALLTSGELKHTDTQEPYILIVEQEVVETEEAINI